MSQQLSTQKIAHRDGSRIPELTLSELYKPCVNTAGKQYPKFISRACGEISEFSVQSASRRVNPTVCRQDTAVRMHPRYLDEQRVGIADPTVYSVLSDGLPLFVSIGQFQPIIVSGAVTERVPVGERARTKNKTNKVGGSLYEDSVNLQSEVPKVEFGKFAVTASAMTNSQPKMQSLSALLANSKKNTKKGAPQQAAAVQPPKTTPSQAPRLVTPTATQQVPEQEYFEPLLFPLSIESTPAICVPVLPIESFDDAQALFKSVRSVCSGHAPLDAKLHEVASYSIAISATLEILYASDLFQKKHENIELQFLFSQLHSKVFWRGMQNEHYICKGAVCAFSIQVDSVLHWIYVRVHDVYPGSSFLVQCSTQTNIKFVDIAKEEKDLDSESNELSYFQVTCNVNSNNNHGNIMDKRKQTSQDTLAMLETLISTPILHAKELALSGISLPSGVLLHGPPGVGKTWSVVHCQEQVQQTAMRMAVSTGAVLPCVRFVSCDASGIMSMVPGESEKRMSALFEQCRRRTCVVNGNLSVQDSLDFVNKDVQLPLSRMASYQSVVVLETVLFLDEIDALCPKREDQGQSQDTHSSRLVSHILTLLDGVDGKQAGVQDQAHLFVIAATNQPHNIDPAVRRSGRLDREICVFPPDEAARAQLQHKMLSKVDTSGINQYMIANALVGFVGADLTAFCRHILQLLQRESSHVVTLQHCIAAAGTCSAAALRGSSLNSLKQMSTVFHRELNAKEEDFAPEQGGMENIKLQQQQAVEWPLKHADTYKQLGLSPPKGILLYGPPGGGKTSIARALCANMKAAFFTVDVGTLYSCYLGEAERLLRDLFTKARANTPAVIFLDEVDSMVGDRGLTGSTNDTGSRVLATLLNEMDGVEGLNGVLVLAATNRIDRLDPALLRPGRFSTKIHVEPPSKDQCAQILRLKCQQLPLHTSIDLDHVVHLALTRLGIKLSAATVAAVARDAALHAIKRAVHGAPPQVTIADFERALQVE